jgi:hypothetical protein
MLTIEHAAGCSSVAVKSRIYIAGCPIAVKSRIYIAGCPIAIKSRIHVHPAT